MTAGLIVESVWWTPSKWAVGRSVGPGVFCVGLTVCTGRGVGLIVSLAVGFGVAAGRGVGLIVVGGATGRGVALTVGLAVTGRI